MHRNPRLTRRKPVPKYQPSILGSPAPSYRSSMNTPPQEADDRLPPLLSDSGEGAPSWTPLRRKRMAQSNELMRSSTVSLQVREVLQYGPGANESDDCLSSPPITAQVSRHPQPPSVRRHRAGSMHRAFQRPTHSLHADQQRARPQSISSEITITPQMQQLNSRTSTISIRQSWRASDSHTRFSFAFTTGTNTSSDPSLDSHEATLAPTDEAAPQRHTIDTRFIFKGPKRRSVASDSAVSRRSFQTAARRLCGLGRSLRNKIARLIGHSKSIRA